MDGKLTLNFCIFNEPTAAVFSSNYTECDKPSQRQRSIKDFFHSISVSMALCQRASHLPFAVLVFHTLALTHDHTEQGGRTSTPHLPFYRRCLLRLRLHCDGGQREVSESSREFVFDTKQTWTHVCSAATFRLFYAFVRHLKFPSI